ncbi:tRNA (adenosine(37)-N6)-threonylcarbamoyltransferase complex dimerization subunit type 1 TsaB [Psychrobacter sp. HD31]|uniref:tRNA (adenosine(37)-N6)-threonylcarbamoyltransferase complex dimerization subunit type 1 TsaB n=1 Tax=Psychrobacter sp. HD31 TaxID=3112003 RepID=UPI003DA5690B
MKLLAIDTVFDKCSVAIMIDGNIVHLAEQTGKRQQTQQILPMIDEALAATNLTLNELDALVFNRGPGAFSSIRINTAVIQALSVATDLPCVGVSSLQVLAQTGHEINNDDSHVYAVMDARMSQVYIGEYQLDESGIMQVVGSDKLPEGEGLLDYEQPTAQPLTMIATMEEDLLTVQAEQTSVLNVQPTAGVLAKVGQAQFAKQGGVPAEEALPVYLRNNAWKTLKEQGKK